MPYAIYQIEKSEFVDLVDCAFSVESTLLYIGAHFEEDHGISIRLSALILNEERVY